jgi:alanine racemase
VKCNAYGHGDLVIARAVIDAGVQCLAVANVKEGVRLYDAGITHTPIILLGIADDSQLHELVKAQLSPFVADIEYAKRLSQAATQAQIQIRVHLKIDTGMNDIGCTPETAPNIAREINDLPFLIYAGTATHLSCSDSTADEDIEHTKLQLSRFREAVDAIRAIGIDPGIVHAANSGGIVFYSESCFDMLHVGRTVYGDVPEIPPNWPSPRPIGLKNAIRSIFQLVTKISAIRKVKKTQTVLSGTTGTEGEDQWIAILPIGFGDGLSGALARKISVTVRGKSYMVEGPIRPNQCGITLGREANAAVGDEVIVIGKGALDAAAVGSLIGIHSSEVMSQIKPHLPRVCVNF